MRVASAQLPKRSLDCSSLLRLNQEATTDEDQRAKSVSPIAHHGLRAQQGFLPRRIRFLDRLGAPVRAWPAHLPADHPRMTIAISHSAIRRRSGGRRRIDKISE